MTLQEIIRVARAHTQYGVCAVEDHDAVILSLFGDGPRFTDIALSRLALAQSFAPDLMIAEHVAAADAAMRKKAAN